MLKDYKIYVDMDGVLANFSAMHDAVKRFKSEEGFFFKLKPIVSNVNFINSLINQGYDINILSISPNIRADYDKVEWLKKYLPNLSIDNIIIIRDGKSKADAVSNVKSILFDDYSKNINDFKEKNMLAFQVKPYITIRKLCKGLIN